MSGKIQKLFCLDEKTARDLKVTSSDLGVSQSQIVRVSVARLIEDLEKVMGSKIAH